jgi:hypothetical protein
MQVTQIAKSKSKLTGVKVYGTILGDKGKSYRFAYIRRLGFRGWICSCDSFVMRLFSMHRNCKHLRHIRAEYGRYGTKVPATI